MCPKKRCMLNYPNLPSEPIHCKKQDNSLPNKSLSPQMPKISREFITTFKDISNLMILDHEICLKSNG